jgi:hypothetical protein
MKLGLSIGYSGAELKLPVGKVLLAGDALTMTQVEANVRSVRDRRVIRLGALTGRRGLGSVEAWPKHR